MKLLALSDLHVVHKKNKATLQALPTLPDDWLILGGDLGETEDHLRWVLDLLAPRYRKLIWVPGNHELWSTRKDPEHLRGVAKYRHLVDICREYDALTPEDPFVQWPEDPNLWICPLFLLYDYSFAPPGMTLPDILAWATAGRQLCADEHYLHPDPFPSRQAWCADRVRRSAQRLAALPDGARTVLINHWPLRQDLVRLFRIPRFTPWCGTTQTEDWHLRFQAEVVVHGHLHMRATDWRDGVRFEEVSLGYPRHWRDELGATGYLRQILPSPPPAARDSGPTGTAEAPMDSTTQTEIEAATFRRLLAHLQANPEVQNIDLMILADFCRNCLAKWYLAEAAERGEEVDYDTAREHIYGMPYSDFKAKHQAPATPEQLAAFAARTQAKG